MKNTSRSGTTDRLMSELSFFLDTMNSINSGNDKSDDDIK
jgi:hypothetical protein